MSCSPDARRRTKLTEEFCSDYDMYMLAFQNAKERTAKDWASLFETADPRLKLTRVVQPARSSLAIMEVIWEG
jgi:hypothetical protein